MASIRSITSVVILIAACVPIPFLVDAAVPPQALAPYAEGLDALNEGRWPAAVSAFSRALESDGDNPEIVLARGVANTLAEDFPKALKDLERAARLGFRGREPELWTYVAEAMSGIIVNKDHQLGGGPRRDESTAVVSIPGHIAQGHDDYTSEYGSFIVYRLGMEYQKYRLPDRFGGLNNPAGVKSPQMRQAMLKAGQLFTEKNYRKPELASISVARAKQASGGNVTTGGLAHVQRAVEADPGNADAHDQAGKAWLEAGRPTTARNHFTIALTFKTDFADAYLGRATAAARMGDEHRMAADLETYKKLGGWLSTRSARSAVEGELSTYKAKGSPDKYLRELQEAAKSGKSMETLIDIATKLHRVKGEQRVRYDEIYQDRLRVLDDAARDNPKNPDKLVDVAAYVIGEADNRSEQVEPRRALQPYRFQVSREQELQRAIQIADRALALNTKHVGGMMQKAWALTALRQYAQADKLADQALDLAGDNPDALRLYGKFRAMRANQISAEAASLRQERCSSSSHDETRSDGVYRVTTTTCYPPSQADLQRAAQFDAMAADLRRRARAAMEKAAAVTKGTVDGLLILADLALWDGRTVETQRYLEQAVKLDPKSLEAQDRLVQHYAQTGQMEKAEEQRLIAANLVQTTVAPLLRLAWKSMDRTAWQAAKGYLARASQIDPEDARVPAYLGVVNEGEENRGEAVFNYRTVLALEEARLQLDEQSGERGIPLGRDAQEFGSAIQARFHLARMAEQAKNQAEALTHYLSVLGYEKRMSPGFESREMFNALWPDQQPRGGALVVAPENAATLIAEAHLQTGKIVAAMGQHDESIKHFRAAAMFGPLRMAGMPQIGNAKGDTNFSGLAGIPAKEAQILLAKELIAKGDAQSAQAVLFEAGTGVPDHLRKQINDINMAMLRLPPRPFHDPYADTPEEQARLKELKARQDQHARETIERQAERQAQRDAERQRMSVRRTLSGLLPLARVVPSLIGRWEMTPDNPSTSRQILTIQPDSRYQLVTVDDGTMITGTAYLQGKQRGRRAKSEPASGQILLYDEQSGQIGALSYDFTTDDTLHLTGASGTKYVTTRQR